ncbi:hypothetical protein [Nocardia wallacei]|uniref:hypothetical protein n=1 Tax=Nocardia wallacei TaxID=480035 RepID=UPI002453C5AB|nr:hypothetical protein [Nocardia wallacei]
MVRMIVAGAAVLGAVVVATGPVITGSAVGAPTESCGSRIEDWVDSGGESTYAGGGYTIVLESDKQGTITKGAADEPEYRLGFAYRFESGGIILIRSGSPIHLTALTDPQCDQKGRVATAQYEGQLLERSGHR